MYPIANSFSDLNCICVYMYVYTQTQTHLF